MSDVDVYALQPEVERVFRSVRERVRDVYARPPRRADRKEDGTLVTRLDHELDEWLGSELLDLHPQWGLVTEESGEVREGTPTWHLDPLDGTLNFTRRLPLFACQAALMDGTEPLFAAIYDPLHDDFAWAGKDAGAWRNGARLQVARRPLSDAVVCVDIARTGAFVNQPETLARVRKAVFRMRALGCVALNLLTVASGSADAFLGTRRHPSQLHDIAPGVLCVREAGGVATRVDGGDVIADPRSMIAAHDELHAHLVELARGT